MVRKLILTSLLAACAGSTAFTPAIAGGWVAHGPNGGAAWGHTTPYRAPYPGYHGCCYSGGAVAAGAVAGLAAGAAIGAAAARPAAPPAAVVYAPPPPRVVYVAPPAVVYAPRPVYYVR